MPTIQRSLQQRLAWVDVEVPPAVPRARALIRAGQAVPSRTVPAMIDTGANWTCIDPSVRRALNLVPFNRLAIAVPGSPPQPGTQPPACLLFKIDLTVLHPNGQHLSVHGLGAVELDIAHTGALVLLGGDVLARCRFLYDGQAGAFSLDY